MKTFYFGQSLNTASVDYLNNADQIRTTIAARCGLQCLDFLGLGDHTPAEVFAYDHERVLTADYAVFLTDRPTWGGGIEVTLRTVKGLPSILLTDNLDGASKMLRGFAQHQNIPFREYRSPTHAADLVQMWIDGTLPGS